MTRIDLTDDGRDDVERLLVATLADDRFALAATADHFARLAEEVDVLRAGRARRRRGWVAVAAAAVVLAAIPAGVVAVGPADRRGSTEPAVQAAPGAVGRWVPLPGRAVGAAVAAGSVWVLVERPDGTVVLQRRDPVDGEVTGEVTPPGGAPGGVVADGSRSVWAWRHTPGEPTVLTEYDTRTLTPLRSVSVLARVNAAVAADGVLWFATSSDMSRVAAGSQTPHSWGSVDGATSLALDRVGGVLVTASPQGLASVDVATGTRLTTVLLATRRRSLAASGGAVWVATSRSDGDIVREVDPRSLRFRDDRSTSGLPPGAAVLASGRTAVWVTSSDGTLTCVRPSDGAPVEQWTGMQWTGVQGAVASDGPGLAVVAQGEALRLLPLDGCPG